MSETPDRRAEEEWVPCTGVQGPGVMGDLSRLDPENRRRVERLLRDRPRRLAALNQHAVRWPDTLAQLDAVTPVCAAELAETLGDDHPHVRWLRGEDRPCTPAQGRAALAVLLAALVPWIVGIVALVWRIWL